MSSNSVCSHTRDKQIGLPPRGRPILLSLVWLRPNWTPLSPITITYFKSKQHSELRSHIHFTKSIPVILLTTKDNSHSWRFNAVIFFLYVQVFQVCIHCIVVYMHVEQPLQKKESKEWHDFTILFASVCTVTRQQNLWHYCSVQRLYEQECTAVVRAVYTGTEQCERVCSEWVDL